MAPRVLGSCSDAATIDSIEMIDNEVKSTIKKNKESNNYRLISSSSALPDLADRLSLLHRILRSPDKAAADSAQTLHSNCRNRIGLATLRDSPFRREERERRSPVAGVVAVAAVRTLRSRLAAVVVDL